MGMTAGSGQPTTSFTGSAGSRIRRDGTCPDSVNGGNGDGKNAIDFAPVLINTAGQNKEFSCSGWYEGDNVCIRPFDENH